MFLQLLDGAVLLVSRDLSPRGNIPFSVNTIVHYCLDGLRESVNLHTALDKINGLGSAKDRPGQWVGKQCALRAAKSTVMTTRIQEVLAHSRWCER